MIQVSTKEGDHYYEDLTAEIFEELLGKMRKGEDIKVGTVNARRHTSDPEGENTTLIDPALYDGSAAKPIKELPNSRPASE